MKEIEVATGYVVEIGELDEDWFNSLIPATQSMSLLAESDFLLDKDMEELLAFEEDEESEDTGFYL